MRFLLDENISPTIARNLNDFGLDVVPVRDRGLLGVRDDGILAVAVDEDRIIVTRDADDFTDLTELREVHPGLVVLGDGTRDQHRAMIWSSLAYIDVSSDHVGALPRTYMVNTIVRVMADLECISEHRDA